MSENGQAARLARHPAGSEPTLADLLDPVALEERLKEARARRAEALARRATKDAAADPAPPAGPPTTRPPATPPTGPLVAPPRPASAARPAARPRLGAPIGMFLVGLCLGTVAMALLAPGSVLEQVAKVLHGPEAPGGTVPAQETAAPAPVTKVAPAPQPSAPPETAPETATDPAPAPVTAAAPSVDPAPTPRPSAPPETATDPAPGLAAPAPVTAAAPSVDPAPAPAPAAAPAPPDVAGLAASASVAAAVPPPDARPAATGAARRLEPAELAVPESEPAPPPASAPDAAAVLAALQPPTAEPPPVEAPPAPDPAPPAALPSARVVVHYPPSASSAAEAAVEALRTAGLAEVTSVPVNVAVGRSNIRFFHAVDAAAATRVTAALPPSRPGDEPQARDFTDFSPLPTVGRIEVWLAGQPPAGAPAAPRRSARAQGGTANADAIERILVERTVERLLRELAN